MQTGASGRPAKRARLEADKRRDALAKVEDKYADIDFTRFHRVEDESSGGATPPRFMLVRPTEAALVKDWRQLSSYEPDEGGRTYSEEEFTPLWMGERRVGELESECNKRVDFTERSCSCVSSC
mgnify:CR=1 FL=1